MSDRWISPPEFARQRGIALRNVMAWIESRELVAVNFAAKKSCRPRWKISPESIEAFEQARTNPGKATTPAKRRRGKPATGGDVIEFY